MAAKSESANKSETSSSITMKPPSSTINDRFKPGTKNLEHKSALKGKNKEEMKTSDHMKHKRGESFKTAAKKRTYDSTKQKGKAIDMEDSSKIEPKKRTYCSTKRKGTQFNNVEDSFKTTSKRKTYNSTKRQASEAIDVGDVDWTDNVPFCPTYHPSREEFKDPIAYIQKISLEAATYGLCKIVSPISPTFSPSVMLKNETKPEKFLAEFLPLHPGYRECTYLRDRKYTFNDFETMANNKYNGIYKVGTQVPPFLVEKDFWTEIEQKSREDVEYVNGVTKSAFSSDPSDPLGSSQWNLQNFARLAQSSLRLLEHDIEGVTNSLLYLGMLFSYVFWSAEPGHLYSIEYHHCGAPRTWYGSPGSASLDFERVVKEIVFPDEGLQAFEAYDILNFKAMLFSPNVMLKQNVPIYKAVQCPGEFVITFPKAYHMGISHGFNCWEAARFTTPHWFPFGEDASERRALYDRPQVVPYQELLCKETMYMFKNGKKKLKSYSYKDLKINFASLIRLHHFACEEIKTRGGAHVQIAPNNNDIVFCGSCQRECYLAYVTCKCFPKPICIFHDIYNECRCKRSRVMSVRKEIVDMQKVAKKFEIEEESLLVEVKELVMIRGWAFGCRPRMELKSELDELISIEAKCRKICPPVTRKPRTPRIPY